jgi:hypothetical protein
MGYCTYNPNTYQHSEAVWGTSETYSSLLYHLFASLADEECDDTGPNICWHTPVERARCRNDNNIAFFAHSI